MVMHPNARVRAAWYEVTRATIAGEDATEAWEEFDRASEAAGIVSPREVTD